VLAEAELATIGLGSRTVEQFSRGGAGGLDVGELELDRLMLVEGLRTWVRPRAAGGLTSLRRRSWCARANRASTVGKLRRALVDERRHAFLLILGGEHRVEDTALEADALGERGLERAVDGLLGHHRDRR
jgi:hypothetical protein